MKAAGTRVAYDHEAYLWKDKVEIPGPTQQVLKLMVSAWTTKTRRGFPRSNTGLAGCGMGHKIQTG